MAHVKPFSADSPGAIVVPAATYGYNGKPGIYNDAVAIGLHTPEEPPDATASTPGYFHNLFGRNASTHYFLAYALQQGRTRVMQMVPERAGAYGNTVEGKPYPSWADPNINLNLQTYSIEIEGYAASIHQTMPRGSDQWNALAWLMADIARRNPAVNLDWTFGHYLVSNQRSDPGQLDIKALVADAKALLNEEDDMTQREHDVLFNMARQVTKTLRKVEEQEKAIEDIAAQLDAHDHH